MNQLTSTSCARSWVIACALASALTPLAARAADWRMSGNDLTNDRNQPNETLIDAGNVATLKPARSFKTLGSASATPLVTGDYVYVPNWGGGLHKLNARTGQVAWSRKVSEYTDWPTRYRAPRWCWRTAFWSARNSHRASALNTAAPICWA
jgi:outer membrane protein assembly factor BamB